MSSAASEQSTGATSTTETATPPSTSTNRRQPFGQGFLDTISTGWAERPDTLPPARPQAPFAAARRDAVSAAFPGKRLVIPAGELKQRSNDTDYPFRAHSAFSHLTGWASDSEPGAVLVFEPRTSGGHEVTLYFRERADRTTSEFYSDASIGEFWIGPRPALAGVAADLGSRHRAHRRLRGGRRRRRARRGRRADALRLGAAAREGRLRDRPDGARRPGHRVRLRRHRRPPPRHRRAPPRRADRRGRVPSAGAQRRQRGRLRHDRGIRPPCVLPALDAQRRRRRAGRSHPDRCRRRGRQPLHRRHHAHAAGERPLHRCAAQGLRDGARGSRRGLRGREAGGEVPLGARGGDAGDRGAGRRMGAAAGVGRGGAGCRQRRPAPPLHGARHEPPPRHRRARLRAGASRHVLRRRPGAGHGLHDRARPVLPDRRSHRSGGVPRHRRAHRGRHPDDGGRSRQPVGRHPAHRRRGRGLDRRRSAAERCGRIPLHRRSRRVRR